MKRSLKLLKEKLWMQLKQKRRTRMKKIKRFLKQLIIHESYLRRVEEQELMVIRNSYTKFL